MLNEKIGTVTDVEKNEILELYERQMGLNELLSSLINGGVSEQENEVLYEKIVKDKGKTKLLFDSWWDKKATKYNWKSVLNGRWTIDFDTNEIYLVEE